MIRGLAAFLLLCALARGAETASVPEAPQPSGEIALELPFALAHFSTVPQGFESKNFNPPIALSGEMRFPFNPRNPKTHFGGYAGAALAFTQPVSLPIVGLSVGATLAIKRFRAELGTDARIQSFLGAPFENTQFDTIWFGLVARVRYHADWITPGLTVEAIEIPTTTLANYEGIETQVAHKTSWMLSPSVLVELPWSFRFSAAIDVIALGSAAIASKEFAFGIEPHTLIRYNAGLGWRTGNVELWAKGALLNQVADAEEHSFQAPLLYGPFLLAPKVFSLEAKWLL